MEIFQKNKKVFLGIGILILVFIVYKMFFSAGPSGSVPRSIDPTAGGLVSDLSVSPSDAIIGRELLAMLVRLQSITLDTSIFTDPAFATLVDKTRAIDPQPFGKTLGRRNPFSEFVQGGGAVATTSAVKNQVNTAPGGGMVGPGAIQPR